MIDPTTMQALKDSFSVFREALGLAKDAKALLPVQQQEALGKSLDQAERTSRIAEAQMAQALGFRLHDCTWPPQIMLALPGGDGQKQCPGCGEKFVPRRRVVHSSGVGDW